MNKNIKKVLYGIFLAIGLVWIINFSYNYKIERSELIEHTGVLSRDPEFCSGGRSGHYLRLKFKKEKFKYLASGIAYQALDMEAFKSDISKGARVTVLIAKESGVNEYLDGVVNVIDIYGLNSEGTDYLALEEMNEERHGNVWFSAIIWCILFGIYFYHNWLKDKFLYGK